MTGDEALPVMVGITVALLPLLVPAGPGNTAVADAAMAGSLLVAAMWVSRERLPLAFPYASGVFLLVIGGALAATVAGAPISTALVLAQDLFLLLWAATLALGRYDPAIIAAATVTWCRVAVVYSAVAIVAYLIGFAPLSGVTAKDGVRASYTFGDPNLAGNYLVTSLFVMMACQRPRDRLGPADRLRAGAGGDGLHRLQRRDADTADRQRALPLDPHLPPARRLRRAGIPRRSPPSSAR